jgi:hypothetical protein
MLVYVNRSYTAVALSGLLLFVPLLEIHGVKYEPHHGYVSTQSEAHSTIYESTSHGDFAERPVTLGIYCRTSTG